MSNLNLPGSVALRGEDLRRGFKASEKVSDHVSVGISGDTFFIEGQGDTDSVRFELERDKTIEVKPADVRSMFSIEYLLDISKAAGKVPMVTAEIGKDYPMRIAFKIAEEHGEIMYIIAPRVESGA